MTMPNWCTNVVNISGTEEKVKEFVDFVGQDFDFDKFVPCPPELLTVSSPVHLVSEEDFQKQEEKIKAGENPFRRNITRRIQLEYIEKYGFDNWYDWCHYNWGVKWSPSDVNFNQFALNQAGWNFQTPWGPPTAIFRLLREKFPDVEIEWCWQEECMQAYGFLNDANCKAKD
jgi:hypothetical protein